MAKSIKDLKMVKTLVTHNGVMHGDDVVELHSLCVPAESLVITSK